MQTKKPFLNWKVELIKDSTLKWREELKITRAALSMLVGKKEMYVLIKSEKWMQVEF